MSPAIHNAAFAQAGLDAVYVPLRVEAGPGCFDRFMDAVMAAPWADFRGLSVTIPHKEAAFARVGAANLDELSRRIGAANTIRIEPAGGDAGATLRGWNTDYAGAIDALCGGMGIAREGLAGRTVAVLGAGGVARALVAALAYYDARVTVYNRTLARGERLAEEFGAAAAALEGLDRLQAEIVINCTSLGMHPSVDDTPLPRAALPNVRVVFDTIYNPIETRLLREARAAGCRTVSGLEMFVNQAAAQFELWTNCPAPRKLMRGVVMQRLQPHETADR